MRERTVRRGEDGEEVWMAKEREEELEEGRLETERTGEVEIEGKEPRKTLPPR